LPNQYTLSSSVHKGLLAGIVFASTVGGCRFTGLPYRHKPGPEILNTHVI